MPITSGYHQITYHDSIRISAYSDMSKLDKYISDHTSQVVNIPLSLTCIVTGKTRSWKDISEIQHENIPCCDAGHFVHFEDLEE